MIQRVSSSIHKVHLSDLEAVAALVKLRNTADSRYPCAVAECRDRTFADGQAADGLFFCHILGAILDLSPIDVRFLAQLNTHTY